MRTSEGNKRSQHTGKLTGRHAILEHLKCHVRLLDSLLHLLDSLLRLLESGLGADCIDNQEDDDEQEEHTLKRQLKSSKLHRWPTGDANRGAAAVR